MKKHLIYGCLAAFGLISLASCSSEEDMPAPSGDGVTFTLRIPGNLATRGTFGDGTGAGDRATLDNLQWTVFEVSGDDANPTLTKVFSDAKTGAFATSQTEEKVIINLAKGKKYQVAFYADDKDNNFVTYTDGDIKVNYDNAASNTAAEDAFIGKSDVFTVEGAFAKNVTLTRPFAQLNWGTDDTEEKSILPLIPSLTGTVKVTQGLYTKMNVISGKVDATSAVTAPVTFAAVNFNALPANTFPVTKEDADAEPYKLIAMNYLLTGDGTVDCELAFNNGLTPVTVSAANVKVNYRTNIYGSLLTSPGTFNIVVDNNFNKDDINIDTATFVNSQSDFEDAIAAGAETIVLNPGEYVLKAPVSEHVTIVGNSKEETVISVPKTSVYYEGKGVTFQNLTYTTPNAGSYDGFLHRTGDINFKDCIINGCLRLNIQAGKVVNIENSEFNVAVTNGFNGYCMLYYASTGSTVNVKNCQFNTVSKGILMYNEGALKFNLNVDNCTFNASTTADKAAIQMHTELGIYGDLHITNSTATGFADIHGGLWNEVNNNTGAATQKFNIWVDGVQVQTAE